MTNRDILNSVLGEHTNYQYMKTMRGKLGCFNCLFKEPCGVAYRNNKFRSCGEFINEFLDAEYDANGKI